MAGMLRHRFRFSLQNAGIAIAPFFLGLAACAPQYYLPPPPIPAGYPYSQQPQVVIVKSCDCPAQGLGYLSIHSAPPFAAVFINGKSEGETPLENIIVPAGQAHIELIHRQFGPMDTVLQVSPGQKIDLKMHLNQTEASLPKG